MNSCFFIGHREANESLLPRLELEIERLIRSENVRFFYVGGYGGFDQIAATAVKKVKKKYQKQLKTMRKYIRHNLFDLAFAYIIA